MPTLKSLERKMQILMRDHPRKTWSFLNHLLLLLAALLAFIGVASAQQTERIHQNGFEPFMFNDTGQNWCANATIANLLCPQAGFTGQDGDHGRDALAGNANLVKIGGGDAGFDYTKISNSGNVLPDGAALGAGPNDWACTRDNVSGLIWEVKTDNPASLRHRKHTYTWYDTNLAVNGGNMGTIGTASICNSTLSQCNTSGFVAAVNALVLCGFSDWRMPEPGELQEIVHYGRDVAPLIDPTYFPNTAASGDAAELWADRSYAEGAYAAWIVSFGDTLVTAFDKGNRLGVRLVRGGH
jgi:hypothetical protein